MIHSQQTFPCNVWVSIFGDHLLGLTFLSDIFRTFVQVIFRTNVFGPPGRYSIAIRRNPWFMHNSAPPHFSLVTRQSPDDTFPVQWIDGNGLISILWIIYSFIYLFLRPFTTTCICNSSSSTAYILHDHKNHDFNVARNNLGILDRVRPPMYDDVRCVLLF